MATFLRSNGATGACLYRRQTEYDTEGNPSESLLYRGTLAEILTIEQQARNAQLRSVRWNEGAEHHIQLYQTDPTTINGTAEQPSVVWRFDTEYAVLDAKGSPRYRSNPITSAGQPGSISDNQSKLVYRAEYAYNQGNFAEHERLRNALIAGATAFSLIAPDGSVESLTFAANPWAVSYLDELLIAKRTSYTVRRPVLQRLRTYSNAYPSARQQADIVPQFRTTARLITDYAIPTIIQSQMPITPSLVQTNSAWGWLETQHNTEVSLSSGMTQETISWRFDAHSTVLYDLLQ